MSNQRPTQAYIEGEIIEIQQDERNEKYQKTIVIVEETNARYPAKLACEFGGRQRPEAASCQVGDLVRIEGYVGSRKGNNGDRWFTGFSGMTLETLRKSRSAPASGGGSRSNSTEHAPPPPGDDSIPF